MAQGRLNRVPWTIGVRKGLAADVNAATTYFIEAELGYATDTGQLYVSDGTDQLRVLTTDSSGDVTISGELNIVTGGTSHSAFHLGEADNEGGYLTSTADDQFTFSGGAEFTADGWRARATTASMMRLDNGEVQFFTNAGETDGSTFTPTRAMTIDSDQDVGIGTVAPGYRLDVLDSLNGYAVRIRNDSAAATGHVFITRMGADDGTGTTYWANVQDGNGDPTGLLQTIAGVFQLTNVSDETLKSNIAPAKLDCLDIINQIEPIEFSYTKQGPEAVVHPCGFSAQNLQQAFPYAVSEKDGVLGTSPTMLIPVLVGAVKTLTEALRTAQERITSIEKHLGIGE